MAMLLGGIGGGYIPAYVHHASGTTSNDDESLPKHLTNRTDKSDNIITGRYIAM